MRNLVHVVLSSSIIFMGMMFINIHSAQATEKLIGTWVINLELSRPRPGSRPSASSTRSYEWRGDMLRNITQSRSTDGAESFIEYESKYDGRFYSLAGSTTRVAMLRLDPFTSIVTTVRGDHMNSHITRTVSDDGTTLTFLTQGIDDEGTSYVEVLIFNRRE